MWVLRLRQAKQIPDPLKDVIESTIILIRLVESMQPTESGTISIQ